MIINRCYFNLHLGLSIQPINMIININIVFVSSLARNKYNVERMLTLNIIYNLQKQYQYTSGPQEHVIAHT